MDKQAEMQLRLARLRNAMDVHGVDALLICADPTYRDAVFYASNYRLVGEAAAVVIPESGEPTLFLVERWDEERARQATWFEDVRVLDRSAFHRTVADVIRGTLAKKPGACVGIVGLEQLTRWQLREVECGLQGTQYKSGRDVIESACLIRTPYEIDVIRRSARLADIGFQAMLDAARPGMREYHLIAEIEYAVFNNGGTDNFQLGVTGKKNQAMIVPRNRVLETGDLILGEITPIVDAHMYAAQLCVTACLGPATQRQRDIYALLVEALEKALSIMKPGLPVQEIARVQNEIISREGYGEYCKPPYMRSRGHNFGLGRVDVAFGSTVELQEGMALVVHPNQFIPEVGYLACGETVVVTSTGIERLNRLTPNKIYEVM